MTFTRRATLLTSRTPVVALGISVLTACGASFNNSNIPKKASEITEADIADDTYRRTSELWTNLLEELKLSNDGTQAAFTTPSKFFDDTPEGTAAFASLTEKLSEEHLKTAKRTGCAEVVSYEELSAAKTFDVLTMKDLYGAKWFLMKYKRPTAEGSTSTEINAALVSVPTASGSYPVVTYGHGGDDGLNLIELAFVFGDLQKNYIIVAPAFPGEGINDTPLVASGVSEPYTTDAEDLLAAHNCVVESTAASDAMNDVRAKVKRNNADKSVSLSVGTSRGGLTSLLAHAKNGALLAESRSEAKQFSCIATTINPNSFVFGDVRVYLEAVVRGYGPSTAFYTLPTAPQLNDLFASFRAPDSQRTAADAALEIQKRDATFNSQLILYQLRNWATAGKGSFLSMHATLDQKIPFTQGLIGAKIFSQVSAKLASAGAAPGAHLTTLGLVPQPPYSTDGGATLGSQYTMHGDFAYLTSKALLNSARFDPDSLVAEPLETSSFAYQKSPVDALKAWLSDTEVGCAAAL